MGEGRRDALRVDFDRSMKVEFHGANVTCDAGLLTFRELDEALGLLPVGRPNLWVKSMTGFENERENDSRPYCYVIIF